MLTIKIIHRMNCENCARNCCKDFKIARELTNPDWVKQLLVKYPYITRTNNALVLGPNGRETIVGIYNCGRLDKDSGKCQDYHGRPRPSICHETGEKFFPHTQCLLKKKP